MFWSKLLSENRVDSAVFHFKQAQNDVQSRVEHIEVLEHELAICNQEIEDLKKEKQLKAEETVKAQTVTNSELVFQP